MNLLLDTHVFLWYISSDSRLPHRTVEVIRNTNNQVYLSVVSVWECMIKNGLGKLPLPEPPEDWIPEQRQLHQIESLELDEESIRQLVKLPNHHRDPFDRILICQALEHRLTLITVDQQVSSYPFPIFNFD
jgi:PIN domain nuclease of toxin-antitoxin system